MMYQSYSVSRESENVLARTCKYVSAHTFRPCMLGLWQTKARKIDFRLFLVSH